MLVVLNWLDWKNNNNFFVQNKKIKKQLITFDATGCVQPCGIITRFLSNKCKHELLWQRVVNHRHFGQ